MKRRIEEIDFLKCTFILLMILFHLVYIGDKYPYAKQLVYTFHMPAFLIISGYLMNVGKPARSFLRSMGWIFVPYAVMESGYVVMSSILPVRERVEILNLPVWADKLFLHPLGPYWYLHTLIVCGITYYIVDRLGRRWDNSLSFLILLALCYTAEAELLGIVSLSNALYFTAGAFLHRIQMSFTSFFRPSFWSAIPFVMLACFPENLNKTTLSGVIMTYLAISLALTLYQYLSSTARQICGYVGSHTFILLVFSPIFTMAVKPLADILRFDPSGILFMIVALLITLAGCFSIAWLIDRLHLSPYFWGKKRMLQPFRQKNDKLTEK